MREAADGKDVEPTYRRAASIHRRCGGRMVILPHWGVELVKLELLWHPKTKSLLDFVRFMLCTDNIHAELNAFIADEHGRPGNQRLHFTLTLAAERAVEGFI